jgi:hypothetical protein
MLKFITWGQYFLFVASIAGGWYAYVFLSSLSKRGRRSSSTFRAEDNSLFSDKSEPIAESEDQASANNEEIPLPEIDDPEFGLVTQTVIQELRMTILECAGLGVPDEEVVAEVRVILSNHPQLRNTAYGKMIDEFIMREGAGSGFDWTVEDVDSFWR